MQSFISRSPILKSLIRRWRFGNPSWGLRHSVTQATTFDLFHQLVGRFSRHTTVVRNKVAASFVSNYRTFC